MSYETISPRELDARIKRGERLRLIDVREPVEFEMARIEGAELLPLSRFNEWAYGLNPEEELVVMCHHGIRSAQVCMALAREGFGRLYNLEGGIDRWSHEVDPSVPQY
ncbi:MAG TPA: rhodanese-like domain-containing protein [Pyrinomonadaceae bacterium]|jgi:rhodanese-related sulfurtransferase